MSTPHGKAEHRRGRNHPVMLHRGLSPRFLNINPSFVHSPLTLVPNTAETIKDELTAHTQQQSYLFVLRQKRCAFHTDFGHFYFVGSKIGTF